MADTQPLIPHGYLLAAVYGTAAFERDLTQIGLSGFRFPDGRDSWFELAAARRWAAEEQLFALAKSVREADREQARIYAKLFAVSADERIRRLGRLLERDLAA